MNTVSSYTKRFMQPLVIGPAFKIIETIFELLTPFIMAKLIDEGIPYHDNTIIIRYGTILVLFALIGYLFAMLAQYIAATTQERYGTDLRAALFTHIQALNLEQTKSIGTNSLITRLTVDIYQLQAAIAIFIRIAPRAPFLLIGSTFMTFLISPHLALVFLVLIPLIIFVFLFTMKHTIPAYERVQQTIDQLALLTNETLSGARVIRAFSRQSEQVATFEQVTSKLQTLSTYAGKFEALLNPTTQFIINVAIGFIVYFGALQINVGSLTQGQLIAIINYITQISLAIVILVNFVVTLARARTSAQRINQVFLLQTEVKPKELPTYTDPALTSGPALLLEDVCFSYPGAAAPVLENISFTLSKGSTLGIIGGTGSGKTTLIRLLGKLYKPTSGMVLVNDTSIAAYPDKLLHQTLQIVFQQATLFRGTIADNLRMGRPEASDEDLWHALEIAQAAEFVQDKPAGLQTKIEQGGKNLSGGQRQRLTIARSLVMNPEIIIFDDTSSALDYVTDGRMRQAISSLPLTKIIVSQRIHAIKDCEEILVLERGTIHGIGTHEQLMKTNTIYQQIAASQEVS